MKYTYTFDQLRDVTPEQVNLRFMDLDWTNRHGGVNPDNYFTADSGTIEASSPECACERLYMRYNVDRPAGYTGRSMSVSDIVNLWDNSGEEPIKTSWFCERIGFVRI